MTETYAVFIETNYDDGESWYTFIRKKDNEVPLNALQRLLQKVDWSRVEEESDSSFELNTEGVSVQTAKEMSMLDLGLRYFHGKFDGLMKPVEIELKKKYRNNKKAAVINDALGWGHIADYLSGEDLKGCELRDGVVSSYSSYDSDTSQIENLDMGSDKDDIPPMLRR